MTGRIVDLSKETSSEEIWSMIGESFDRRFEDFDERIRSNVTRVGRSLLKVSIQADRIASLGVVSPGGQVSRCKMCSIYDTEPCFRIEDYCLSFYDFPPFRNQLLLFPIEHRPQFTGNDLEFVSSISDFLGCPVVQAGSRSGASEPRHTHWHLISAPVEMEESGSEVIRESGSHTTTVVNNWVGGVSWIRIAIDSTTGSLDIHERLARFLEKSHLGFNLMYSQGAWSVILRSQERSRFSGGLRMGAIEMVGLHCLRSHEGLARYLESPLEFHREFIRAFSDVCVDRLVVRGYVEMLADAIDDDES